MEKKKILIVDNDLAVCILVNAIVKKIGYESVIATDVHKAIEILKKDEKIFLVITDVHMPFINGITLVEEIWQHFSYLKVIVMTSDISDEILSMKNRLHAVVEKLDLFHSLTCILKRLDSEKNGFVRDLRKSFDSTT
ncbi:MAG: response regulator [Candidatus Omnitrophica bacterium]|nr:response regulator [Candidatus Omnitrophota bacterium]